LLATGDRQDITATGPIDIRLGRTGLIDNFHIVIVHAFDGYAGYELHFDNSHAK